MIKIVIFYVTLEFLNLVNLQPSHIQHFSTFSSFKVTIKKKKKKIWQSNFMETLWIIFFNIFYSFIFYIVNYTNMYNIIKVTATMYLFMQISTIILTLHEQQCKLTILHFTGLALFLCYVKFALICSLVIPTPHHQQQPKKKIH